MAASESIVEQILANVRTQLAAIRAGDDYHYTPATVVRVDNWHSKDLDPTIGDVIYLVRDTGDVRPTSNPAEFGDVSRELDVPLLLACKDTRSDINPHTAAEPVSGTIRNRMIRDAIKKLYVDESRGSLAIETNVTDESRDFHAEGWIVAVLIAVVIFHHDRSAP